VSQYATFLNALEDSMTPVGAPSVLACVDERVANDASYLQTNLGVGGDTSLRVELGSIIDPGVNTGHVIRIRSKTIGLPDLQWTIRNFELWQGILSTPIAIKETYFNMGVNWSTREIALSEAEAALITDYNDLWFTTRTNHGGNPVNHLGICWMEFECPNSPNFNARVFRERQNRGEV
jgi:hypothetical protein